MADTYLQKKNEDDISKIVTCREATDRQTNKQTNRWKRSESDTFENSNETRNVKKETTEIESEKIPKIWFQITL